MQARHRRMTVQVDQHVGRKLVQLALARAGRRRASRAAARSPKSPSRSSPLSRSRARISGALSPRPISHSATAMNGRGSSCGGGASISTALRSAVRPRGNSGGTTHRRQAAGSRPRPSPKRQGNRAHARGGIIGEAIAPPMTGAPSAVKILVAVPRELERQAERFGPRRPPGALRPFDQQHRVVRRRRAQALRSPMDPRSGTDRHATPADRHLHRAERSRSSGSAPRRRGRARR